MIAQIHAFRSRQVLAVTHLFLLAAFILAAYYPALHAPFVLDDIPNIVLNSFVQPETFAGIWNAVSSQVSGSRPLAMLSFAVNFLAGGLDVYGYHVFNLVVHISNAVILYYSIIVLLSLPDSRLRGTLSEHEVRNLALWSALLWALNPVQHQAVTYIVQRMTSLATLFYLLAILIFLKYRAGRISAAWASGIITFCFAAGMACKEVVITLPFCLIFIDHYLVRPDRPINPRWMAAAAGIVAVIGFMYVWGNMPVFFERFPNRSFSPYERVLTEPRILWHYLSLLMFPLPERLYLEHDFTISKSLFHPAMTSVSIAAILTAMAASWQFRHKYPLAAFAILFYFLASSVEASFLNLGLAYLHRLYLPSLFIFPGLLLCIPMTVRKYMGPVLLVVIALSAYGTQQRNDDWSNSTSLWEIEYARNTDPALSILNGGVALVEHGRFDDAINLLSPMISKLSGAIRLSCLHTLALAYYYKGEYHTALQYLEMIDDAFEEYDLVLFYQGLSLLNLNLEADQQIELLARNYSEQPYSSILSAEKLRKTGRQRAALEILEDAKNAGKRMNAVELNLVSAYLANVYLDTGQYQKAYALYLEMISIDPDDFFAWQQIYAMQVSAGDLENAAVIRAMLESKGVVIPESTP